MAQTPPIDAPSPALESLKQGPAAAQGEIGRVEALGTAIEQLPFFRHMAEVMPAADLFFGGGMLLFVVLIHAAGMRLATQQFEKHLQPLILRPSTWRPDVIMSVIVGGMLVLHLAEIFVWAAALVYSGLVANWRVAGFFAANTYTTVGYGDFVLPPGWHMLAPIIAMSGLFTFGWTGSVLVEIVRRCQEVKAAAKAAQARHRPPPKPPRQG